MRICPDFARENWGVIYTMRGADGNFFNLKIRVRQKVYENKAFILIHYFLLVAYNCYDGAA